MPKFTKRTLIAKMTPFFIAEKALKKSGSQFPYFTGANPRNAIVSRSSETAMEGEYNHRSREKWDGIVKLSGWPRNTDISNVRYFIDNPTPLSYIKSKMQICYDHQNLCDGNVYVQFKSFSAANTCVDRSKTIHGQLNCQIECCHSSNIEMRKALVISLKNQADYKIKYEHQQNIEIAQEAAEFFAESTANDYSQGYQDQSYGHNSYGNNYYQEHRDKRWQNAAKSCFLLKFFPILFFILVDQDTDQYREFF